jgi:hypothetical protein
MAEDEFKNLFLEVKLQKWQKKLRLNDWKINVEFKNCADIWVKEDGEGGAVARNFCYIPGKSCNIWILNEQSYKDQRKALDRRDPDVYDPELFLVHELVHILWKPVEGAFNLEDLVVDDAFETCVELTAQALVNIERERV